MVTNVRSAVFLYSENKFAKLNEAKNVLSEPG